VTDSHDNTVAIGYDTGMSDEEALLAAIIASPDDDLPRLVYADWLDEHTGAAMVAAPAARAEFIRVQIERARAAPGDPRLPALARREGLLGQHRKEWGRPIQDLLPGAALVFRRGFVEQMTVQAAHFLRRRADVFRLAPIREVTVTQVQVSLCELSLLDLGAHVRLRAALPGGWNQHDPVTVDCLRPAPVGLETELRQGRWLVLAWAVWSGPDRHAAGRLFRFAEGILYRLGYPRLALRPFDRASEFTPWCPVEQPYASPHWLLLEGGRLIGDLIGPSPPADLSAFGCAEAS
jgi:uncharacterized protein (TIGR02996 family)